MTSTEAGFVPERLTELLAAFRLPTASAELVPRLTAAGHAAVLPALLEVFVLEADDRRERRIDRLRRASQLPPGKTFDTLNVERLPKSLVQRLRELSRGDFLERAENILAFGLPGVGKSHAACAIGHALVQAGHAVLFTPAYELVQQLLAAKRDLDLPRALRKLDAYALIVLDDIGYVQQSPEEVEVLFTLLAERYERRSTLITSNLVFSEWGRIFKDPMTTAAAIDRVVHHSVILEFTVESYRTEAARKRSTGSHRVDAGKSLGDRAPLRADDSASADNTTAGASSPRTPGGSAPARSNSDRASTELADHAGA